MNSLIRRVQNQNDLSKIWAVLDICYQAGRTHEELNLTQKPSGYVMGRMQDLVALLNLRFDNEGNMICNKIADTEQNEITTESLSFDAKGYINVGT